MNVSFRPKDPADITPSSTTPHNKATDKMAEAAGGPQEPPTFKLVLVGDGGTGKVSSTLHLISNLTPVHTVIWRSRTEISIPCSISVSYAFVMLGNLKLIDDTDHLREASLDRRI